MQGDSGQPCQFPAMGYNQTQFRIEAIPQRFIDQERHISLLFDHHPGTLVAIKVKTDRQMSFHIFIRNRERNAQSRRHDEAAQYLRAIQAQQDQRAIGAVAPFQPDHHTEGTGFNTDSEADAASGLYIPCTCVQFTLQTMAQSPLTAAFPCR